MSDQLSLAPKVPEHHVKHLAEVLAGFRWPGRKSYGHLTKPQQQATQDAARLALEHLAAQEGE